MTRSGMVAAALAVVLTFAGAVLGYPELAAMGFTCGAALLVAWVWILIRPDLEPYRTLEPGRVSEGDEARSHLAVTNRGRRRTPPLVATELVGSHGEVIRLPSLAVGETFSLTRRLPTGRRGRYVMPPLMFGHSDPFRLVRVGSRRGSQLVLWVHPRFHHVAPLPSAGAQDVDGSTSPTSPQGGVAFHSLREYLPGDDWRLIHWRSTARTEQLMVRHNVVPDESQHMVIIDGSSDVYPDGEAFEEAVRVAASWSVAAVRGGCPVRLCTTAGRTAEDVPLARSEARPVTVLDLLAEVARSDGDPGLTALPGLIPADRTVAVGVVTGRAAAAGQLALLPSLRSRVASLSLAQVGGVISRSNCRSEAYSVFRRRRVTI